MKKNYEVRLTLYHAKLIDHFFAVDVYQLNHGGRVVVAAMVVRY